MPVTFGNLSLNQKSSTCCEKGPKSVFDFGATQHHLWAIFQKKVTEKTLDRLTFLTSKTVSPFSFGGLLLSLLPPPLS